MTDRPIDQSCRDVSDQHNCGPCLAFTTQSIGYAVYVDGDNYVKLAKSTDGGTNWTAANTTVDSGHGVLGNAACWLDSWTDGDSGTLLHMAYIGPGNDTLYYHYLDTNGDSLRSGGAVTVGNHTTWADNDGNASICKSTDGELFCLAGGSVGTKIYRSTDGGDNWTDITASPISTTFTDDDDSCALTPLANGDILFVGMDRTATTLYSCVWNKSSTSWDASLTTVDSTLGSGSNGQFGLASDSSGNAYVSVCHQSFNATSSALKVYKYTGSWATKTSPGSFSYMSGSMMVVDTTTGDLYVIYAYGSNGSLDCYYKKSTNDGSSWGSETQLSSTTDDLRFPTGTGPAQGGDRVYAAWWNDDLNDLIGESIAAVAASAGIEITPAQGNLTFTTTVPTVEASDNREITPAQGNLTLSTTVPTVEVLQPPIEITPPQGDLTLSSTAPTVEFSDNHDIQPGQGDLALSTTIPIVDFSDNREIIPPQADLVFSTTAPTVEVAAGVEISPPQGNLSFSATAPTVEISENREILPGSGDLELSTTAPTVTIESGVQDHEITPPQGNLIFTSFAPTIEVSGEREGIAVKKKKVITDTALTRQLKQARKLVEKAKEEKLTVTEEERAKKIIRDITEVKEQEINIPQIQEIIIEITIVLGQLALLNEEVARALYIQQLQEEDEEILLLLASGL